MMRSNLQNFQYIPNNTYGCNMPNQQFYDLLRQLKQSQKIKTKKSKKFKFNSEEDQKLISLVKHYGDNHWNLIAEQMKNRNARQCRERWKNYLNPQLNSDKWTEEEDIMLISKFNEIGPRWTNISIYFKNRTTNSIRNRLIKLLKKNKNNPNFHINSNYFTFFQSPTFSMSNLNVDKIQGNFHEQLPNPIELTEKNAMLAQPKGFKNDGLNMNTRSNNASLGNQISPNQISSPNIPLQQSFIENKDNNKECSASPLNVKSKLKDEKSKAGVPKDDALDLFWKNDDENSKNSFLDLEFI